MASTEAPLRWKNREKYAMASANVQHFTEQNFENDVLKSDVPVLVDFTATWCGPCQKLAPIVDKVADTFQGKVKVGKLDIDESPNLARKYGIRSVPTVIVFKGGTKTGSSLGVTRYDDLVKLLGL
jgi:thioredoxin 1